MRVANEAEFILNRMRADDVLKHADFEVSVFYVYISPNYVYDFSSLSLSLSLSLFLRLVIFCVTNDCEILGSVAVRANVAGPTGGGTNVRPSDHGRAQTGQCHCQPIVGEGPQHSVE